ncbi:hypothetical protein ACQPT2_21090 [Erwinia amylovora]
MSNKKEVFYHFTGVPMLHSILCSQGLNQGYIELFDGQFLRGYPWVTTCPLPYGHGLSNGKESITEKNENFLRRAGNISKNKALLGTHNKQVIRITIDGEWLKRQDKFISYVKLMRKLNQPKDYAKKIGVAGLIDTSRLNEKKLIRWMKSDKTKEKTWYVFDGVIPVEQFISIDFMVSEHVYVPYNFESHGRKIMENSGFFCVSSSKLQELNKLTSSQFIGGSVFALSTNEEPEPYVAFRNKNYNVAVALLSKKFIAKYGCEDKIEKDREVLFSWVGENEGMLMGLFNASNEMYKKRILEKF